MGRAARRGAGRPPEWGEGGARRDRYEANSFRQAARPPARNASTPSSRAQGTAEPAAAATARAPVLGRPGTAVAMPEAGLSDGTRARLRLTRPGELPDSEVAAPAEGVMP